MSRFHAEIVRIGEQVEVRDLSSRTSRVNGELVRDYAGARLRGRHRALQPDLRRRRVRRALQAEPRLRNLIDGGRRWRSVEQILAETTLSIEPGQLVAFISKQLGHNPLNLFFYVA